MTVEFRLPMPPSTNAPGYRLVARRAVAWSRASGGRTVRLFTPKKQRNNAAALRIMAQQQMHRAVTVRLRHYRPNHRRNGDPENLVKEKTAGGIVWRKIWPAKRPDLSNICKQVEAALNGVVFRDDALIVRYDTMQKRYSAQPKIVATYQPVRK